MTTSMTLPSQCAGTSDSPTLAIISLSALAHNLRAIQGLISPSCRIMAIVKADAYGHGGMRISRALSSLGISQFGVATVQEGVALRQGGIEGEIIVLGGQFSWQLPDLLRYELTPVISDVGIIEDLTPLLAPLPKPFPLYIKVDTGMARLGLVGASLIDLLASPRFFGVFQLQGLLTHLADADNQDPTFTSLQLNRFSNLVTELERKEIPIPPLSSANTAGILFHPESHLNLVRPGLMLFGYPPVPNRPLPIELKPVMRVSTRIVQTRLVEANQPVSYNGIFSTRKPSRLAVLPIGYAHGYSRRLSNKGKVLVRGKRVPIVGRICMDMMVIDITNLPDIRPGEEVVLIGSQGNHTLSAMDLAVWQETVPYEVLCNLGPRVNRVYEELNENADEK